MSARKAAHERRMELLNRTRHSGRFSIHCEGGIALSNPDLKRLVRDGYLVISRDPGVPKWSKKFERLTGPWKDSNGNDTAIPKSFHGSAMIRRSYAKLTPKGAALLGMGWVQEES